MILLVKIRILFKIRVNFVLMNVLLELIQVSLLKINRNVRLVQIIVLSVMIYQIVFNVKRILLGIRENVFLSVLVTIL